MACAINLMSFNGFRSLDLPALADRERIEPVFFRHCSSRASSREPSCVSDAVGTCVLRKLCADESRDIAIVLTLKQNGDTKTYQTIDKNEPQKRGNQKVVITDKDRGENTVGGSSDRF